MPSIDIVIPCAGRVADLLRLLGSIHGHAAAGLAAHVASVTASDDRHSAALGEQVRAAHPAVRYVAGPARGPAANRNHGSRQGQAEWLLFLDDDCYLESDLLETYARHIAAEPGVDVFEGAIHAVGERPNGNHHAPLNTDGGHLWSCNLLIRRRTFEALGGFDERFPFACLEDCDLMDRLRAAGTPIAFSPKAVVFHPWRSVGTREVARALVSHAIYGELKPAFARSWTAMHLLRALRGRVRQYRSGRFSTIPLAKYRTVAADIAAPVVVFALMRSATLRGWVGGAHLDAIRRTAP